MAARALNATMAPDELALWVHSTSSHDLPLAEGLAQLDDVYDTLE